MPLASVLDVGYFLCIKVSITNKIQVTNVDQEFLSVNFTSGMLLGNDVANYTGTAFGMRWSDGG